MKTGLVSKSPMTVSPRQPRWFEKFGATLLVWCARLLMASWRCRIIDEHGVLSGKQNSPVIWGIWHNRLAISMVVYGVVRKRRPAAGLAAFISASKDGGLLAYILSKFQVQAVRGSSSRRGRQALLECIGWMEKNYHAAITPDGPRGPVYRIQDGIIGLAQITGAPIIPVYADIRWKLELKSWDRFQIPLPFSRCLLHLGAPVSITRDSTEEEIEVLKQKLKESMRT